MNASGQPNRATISSDVARAWVSLPISTTSRGHMITQARGLVAYAGRASEAALIAAVAGLVNGTGSVGAVLQGLFASQLVSLLGWPGLFAVLAAAMLAASLALLPAVAVEAAGLRSKLKAP